MIINLSYAEGDAISYIHQTSDKYNILDVTGVLKASITQNSLITLRKLEGIFEVEEKSIQKYIAYCSKLSRGKTSSGNFRDIKISDFPLYWASDISVKHYELHWLSAICFLDEALASGILKLEENVNYKVIVPKNSIHCKSFILTLFKKYGLNSPQVISRGINNEILLFALFIRNLANNIVGYFLLKLNFKRLINKSNKLGSANFVIANIYASIWPKDKWENYWKEYYKFFMFKKGAWIIPFFNNYKGSNRYNFNKVPAEFLKAQPSFYEVLVLMVQAFISYIRTLNYFKGNYSFIGKEIRKSLLSPGFLISHKWYFRFAKSVNSTGTTIIYDEEFYPSGRFISHALNLQKGYTDVKYFGLQHGIFFNPSHTVYTITDSEIAHIHNNDGLPLPQRFVVWGDFFKKSFLANNTLPDDFVLTLGSLKHIMAIKNEKKNLGTNGLINILWCTTLLHLAKNEFEQFKHGLEKYNDKFNLIVRKHPGNHIKDNFFIDLLSASLIKHYRFSINQDILKDIAEADIVFSTSYSTTFIDAIFSGKLSVRFYNYASFPVLTYINCGSIMVYNKDDVTNVITDFIENKFTSKQNNGNLNNFMHRDISDWDRIVSDPTKLSLNG